MHAFTAVIERCSDTGLYVGYVPGFPGAHSQGESLDELNHNLKEVIEMLLEDGDPVLDSEFIGTQNVSVSSNGPSLRFSNLERSLEFFKNSASLKSASVARISNTVTQTDAALHFHS